MVRQKSLNIWPASPPVSASGRNTATVVSVDAVSERKTSFVPYGSLTDGKVTLVTDGAAAPELLKALRQDGARIIIAEKTGV